MSDNSTALSYLRRQGGMRSRQLWRETDALLRWAESQGIRLLPRFVPGRANSLADRLSRQGQVVSSEWTLNMSVCRALWRLWGTPQVDLFATCQTTRLAVFCSPVPDPRAWAVDALLQQWDGLWLYAFPPLALIRQVLAKLRSSVRTSMILVAPLWPQQGWFPDLLQLATDHRRLPSWPSLLRQPLSGRAHGSVSGLALHAWRRSSVSSEREAFRAGLPVALPSLRGTPPST